MTTLSPCGTRAAYARHLRHKEVACEPCRKAHHDVLKAWRLKNPEAFKAIYTRNNAKQAAKRKAKRQLSIQTHIEASTIN